MQWTENKTSVKLFTLNFTFCLKSLRKSPTFMIYFKLSICATTCLHHYLNSDIKIMFLVCKYRTIYGSMNLITKFSNPNSCQHTKMIMIEVNCKVEWSIFSHFLWDDWMAISRNVSIMWPSLGGFWLHLAHCHTTTRQDISQRVPS